MCGRYTLFTDEEYQEIRKIIDEANQRSTAGPVATGEIYPTNLAPILLKNQDEIHADAVKWGYPSYQGKGTIINARSETAAEKRMFAKSMQTRRCIVPTTGFYEWKSELGKSKQKYWFTGEENILYLAGLYNDFQEERRFVILTAAANASVADVHNRMPVVLQASQIEPWINDVHSAYQFIAAPMPLLQKKPV